MSKTDFLATENCAVIVVIRHENSISCTSYKICKFFIITQFPWRTKIVTYSAENWLSFLREQKDLVLLKFLYNDKYVLMVLDPKQNAD